MTYTHKIASFWKHLERTAVAPLSPLLLEAKLDNNED